MVLFHPFFIGVFLEIDRKVWVDGASQLLCGQVGEPQSHKLRYDIPVGRIRGNYIVPGIQSSGGFFSRAILTLVGLEWLHVALHARILFIGEWGLRFGAAFRGRRVLYWFFFPPGIVIIICVFGHIQILFFK